MFGSPLELHHSFSSKDRLINKDDLDLLAFDRVQLLPQLLLQVRELRLQLRRDHLLVLNGLLLDALLSINAPEQSHVHLRETVLCIDGFAPVRQGQTRLLFQGSRRGNVVPHVFANVT